MKILLTNDDGIYAPGLIGMARGLAKNHEVSIVAPDRQRSAASHSMTFTRPLIPQQADGFGFISGRAYMLNGTPVDCVKVAAATGLVPTDFELVVSGLNNGPNLGTDVIYSGTAAAALEGAIKGRYAVAFSIDCNPHSVKSGCRHLDDAVESAVAMVNSVVFSVLPAGIALNVNFPDIPSAEYKGVRVCPLGKIRYDDEMDVSRHMRGYDYYWTVGTQRRIAGKTAADIDWIAQGGVSVTPIVPDLTAYGRMDVCRGALGGVVL